MPTNPWLFSVAESGEFFEALRDASVEVLRSSGLPIDQGHKRYRSFKHGRPIGVTEHFTAGVAWKGVVRWLNDGTHDNSVSCQMLILDRMLPEVKAAYDKHHELKDLEVVVLLLSDGIVPCWHAGWVNRLSFGIENRNAGLLRGKPGDWRWWANKWRAKFPYKQLGKVPVLIDGQWWEPYTVGQIKANILVGQHLHCLYRSTGGLEPGWFLPHSATTGSKRDTGRAFPLQDVRDAVFAQAPIKGVPWLKAFADNPSDYVLNIEDEDDRLFLLELPQTDRREGEADLAAIGEMPSPDLQALVQAGSWKDELDSVRRALAKLGYVTGGHGPTLDPDTALAVYQFQKSVGLKPYDKIPGDETQEALHRRLAAFRLQ